LRSPPEARRKHAAPFSRRMLKNHENRLLTRAAQNRAQVFAVTYRAATVRERLPRPFFSILGISNEKSVDRTKDITNRRRWEGDVEQGPAFPASPGPARQVAQALARVYSVAFG
jgi:hypothetical protein